MPSISERFRSHHREIFQRFGATAQGVQWGAEEELQFRYDKVLAVLDHDLGRPESTPSLLDAGCGWGGLLQHARQQGLSIEYTGIDLVEEMAQHGRRHFPGATFLAGDVQDLPGRACFDYVVCNGIMTQRLTASIVEMEAFCNRLIRKLYDLCRYAVAFNMMSTRVNFMAENLYYRNPAELLGYLLMEVTPRVKLDHGYSSLGSGRGKLYDYTVYLYKDP